MDSTNDHAIAERPEKRSRTLISVVVVLLCVVVLLQLGLLFQRQTTDRRIALRSPQPGPTPHAGWLWSRVVSRPSPSQPVTPDRVWNHADQIERMHDQINGMFEQAFREAGLFAPPSATRSNATTSGRNVLPADSFRHIEHMRHQIDSMFAQAMNDMDRVGLPSGFEDGWAELDVTPGMTVADHGAAYEIAIHLPGVDKSCIQVGLESGILSIVVDRHQAEAGEDNGSNRVWAVRQSGHFERRLRLPHATPRPADVKATYVDGLLRIVVPKEEMAEEQKQIPVI